MGNVYFCTGQNLELFLIKLLKSIASRSTELQGIRNQIVFAKIVVKELILNNNSI